VGFVSSTVDRFFNQLFATGAPALEEVEAALAGRPGFVWLCDDAAAADARTGGGGRPVRVVHGMRTTIRVSEVDERTPAAITAVSSFEDLADWHTFTGACSASILAALMNGDGSTARSDRAATTRSSSTLLVWTGRPRRRRLRSSIGTSLASTPSRPANRCAAGASPPR
jgi:hypothetical protein